MKFSFVIVLLLGASLLTESIQENCFFFSAFSEDDFKSNRTVIIYNAIKSADQSDDSQNINIDLFDCLSLDRLIALGICKRMEPIVGNYIRTHYSAIQSLCREDDIVTDDKRMRLNGLASYMKKFIFHYLEVLQEHPSQTYMDFDRFKWLEEILLTRVTLTDNGIERIKPLLEKVQTLKLNFPHYFDKTKEFFDSFLQFCPNVKRLCIQAIRSDTIVGSDNRWLLRKYPTLEHFELEIINRSEPIAELKTFFEQNLSIKHLALNVETILENSETIKNIQQKFDVLSIFFCHTNTFELARDALNKLYGMGKFKELHVYFHVLYNSIFDKTAVDQLKSYNGLTKLYVRGLDDGVDLSPLINLKKLCLDRASDIENMKELAQTLINLETIQFIRAELRDIMPFIKDSVKLNKIIIYNEIDANTFKLTALNDARMKLTGARKITMYVREDNYLTAKWSKTGTKLKFIEVKRRASLELKHDFDYNDYWDEIF
ncbi:uncharacterized protein LOC116338807 isoform X1 [Contarinia nasturtii]|uniref:uncharacterized protein LOC116338807 isoform X1 n=1 Tax=Contarinia nasturtii TaxID=265458 RepID=UPI0012D39007|nr:uncharacterized protein LOC116338807 isoform X1 [Contarinia nasturtii]